MKSGVFVFSQEQKSAEYDRFRCSKRWSGKGGAKISTELDYFLRFAIFCVSRKRGWFPTFVQLKIVGK